MNCPCINSVYFSIPYGMKTVTLFAFLYFMYYKILEDWESYSSMYLSYMVKFCNMVCKYLIEWKCIQGLL